MRLFLLFLISFWHFQSSWAEEKVSGVHLIDHNGKPLSMESFKGKPLFLSFFYTRCPKAHECPMTVHKNKILFRKARQSAPSLRFLLVTLDPKGDTPAVLKQYAHSRKLDLSYFTLATGDEENLKKLHEAFNILAFPRGAQVAHNMKSILLDKDLNFVEWFRDNEWAADDVLKALSKPPEVTR